MGYRGKHRKPLNRAKARTVTLALAVASSCLAVPLTTTTAAHSTMPTFDYQRAAWLQASDITINPPGPKPGEAVAPAVNRGYVITGNQLQRFNITATPEGQQELATFVARIKHYQGITLDATTYNVFATPPIIYIDFDDLAGDLSRLVTSAQALVARYTDPETLNQLVEDIKQQLPKIQHDEPGVPDTSGIVALANNVVVLATGLITNPPVTPPAVTLPTVEELAAEVARLTAAVDALLVSLGFETVAQMSEDPTHAAPVGTDIVSNTLDGTLGDVVILPIGTSVAEVSAVWHESMLKVSTVIVDTPLAPAGSLILTGSDQVPEGEPGWAPAGPTHCYDRKSNNTAWYDPCRAWHTLSKDGDPNRKTWAHKQWGTAKSKGSFSLDRFEVKAWRKAGTPDQDWLDWSPRADADHGNCSSGTIGVNVNSFYLEHTANQCDEWDIHKGAEPADFANLWRGTAWRKERDVAAMKSTSTPNGYSPTNYVRYDYYAY